MSQGIYSRLCALNTLNAILDGQKSFDDAFDKYTSKYDLNAQDKSFVHALCGYVLRYKHDLQRVVNKGANRNADITPPMLNSLLLMGAAQIYFMESVPDHAAVDTCVDLAKRIKCPKQSGLVNAVLRRLLREDLPKMRMSVPSWLIKIWISDYGVEIAKQIETASMNEAPIGISNKDGAWSIHQDGSLDLSPDQWVQDFSSAMPVSLLNDDLKGKHVLDLCAAPGGKTMQLAARGATVTSVDISEKRLKRLHDNLERTNLQGHVEIACANILKYEPIQKYDVVLLDAPCSATGTIRRHPDLPYIRTPRELKTLIHLQHDMLNRAKNWVNDDGVLVYCTCSLQKDEGERQIELFLKNNPKFKRQNIDRYPQWQTPDGDMRLMPHYGDMDGFFIAVLSLITK